MSDLIDIHLPYNGWTPRGPHRMRLWEHPQSGGGPLDRRPQLRAGQATIKAKAVQQAAADLRGIADELQSRGIRAPRGDTWHPTAVARLFNRLNNTTHTN